MAYIYKQVTDRILGRPPIIVVGMHRSGTGLLTRILQRLGVFMGQHITANEESVFFQEVNKDALDLIGCSWRCIDCLPNVSALQKDYRWLYKFIDDEVTANIARAHFGLPSADVLADRIIWGWKDPRNSLLLPIWLQVFPRAQVVHIFRDGRDVALSLLNREIKREKNSDFFSLEVKSARFYEYFKLWEKYIDRIVTVEGGKNTNFVSIRYEELVSHPESKIEELISKLGIESPRVERQEIPIDRNRSHRFRAIENKWIDGIDLPQNTLLHLGYVQP
jgi:hypothetical protein